MYNVIMQTKNNLLFQTWSFRHDDSGPIVTKKSREEREKFWEIILSSQRVGRNCKKYFLTQYV